MSVRALCVALAICSGCGRIGFDGLARSDDAGPDDTITSDAPPVTFGAWSTPDHLTSPQSGENDWEGTIDSTGLVMVFARQNGSDSDLMVMTRATRTSAFGAPTLIPGASSNNYELGAAWSFDNQRLYYHYDDGAGNDEARYLSNLGNGTFSATGVAATELPDEAFSFEFSSDGLEVFYTTGPAINEYDLHHARRSSTTENFTVYDDDILELQRDVGIEGWPTLDVNQNVLYFERETPGGGKIFQATRTGRYSRFTDLVEVDYLQADDGDPDISTEGTTLLISSVRLGGGLQNELFIMTRTPL